MRFCSLFSKIATIEAKENPIKWQMFRWLLQWLNKFLQYTLGGLRISNPQTSQGRLVADQLPELTNADLEFLFNELLEGVHQARGQQWALKYLQRM